MKEKESSTKTKRDLENSLPAFAEEPGTVNVIIDTPRNSRNKYAYDSETDLFKLSGILTQGHVFPYNFGFIPNTLGGDGDPLDVLVLMDESVFVGCWVECRIIGALMAMQTEVDGNTNRNDRFFAVETNSDVYGSITSIDQLDTKLVDEVEHFFVSYNEEKGKRFEVIKRIDRKPALDLIQKCCR